MSNDTPHPLFDPAIEATRATFERLVARSHDCAVQDGHNDPRTTAQLFARDPESPIDYTERDISAIWFGWKLGLVFAHFGPRAEDVLEFGPNEPRTIQ